MKLIRNFEINTNDLSALQEDRSFKVSGDNSAVFSLQVKTSTGKFYNFKSKLFETTITSEHRLANQVITGKSYSGNVLFPADADGETYTILLSAEPHFDTEIMDSLTGNINNISLDYNPVLYQVDITQVADVVLNFAPKAATTATYTTASLANQLAVTQSPTVTTPITSSVSWTIANNTTDVTAFGLVPTLDLRKNEAAIGDKYWLADTTFTIDDTTSSGGSTHDNYTIDDISDLEIGMSVVGQSCTLTRVFTGAYNATNPTIRNKPRIKLSTAKALVDTTTLTARGYGKNAVEKAIGCSITFNNFKLIQKPLTTTVRSAVSNSTSVTVGGTYGIGVSAVSGVETYIEGFGVDNSTDNPIVGVSASEASGTLTMTTNQTLVAGTNLNIINCSNSYTITGDITVHRMPASTKTIYLDLDEILTLGTAS
tara:strand:+ start:7666 stop:8946 length:1281 start_codon:yes stop_codon:yes gene_type:complete